MRARRLVGMTLAVGTMVLAGCSGEQGSVVQQAPQGANRPSSSAPAEDEAAEGPEVLTAGQAQVAVLALTDLPEGYVESEPDDDEESTLGCLDDVKALSDDAAVEVEASYVGDNEMEVPEVGALVASYGTVEEPAARLADLQEAVAGCARVDVTEDGARIQLDIVVDETASDSADQQLNVGASGTVTDEATGLELPITFSMTLLRVGNNIAGVSYVDLADGDDGLAAQLGDRALERLTAVMDGEEPAAPPQQVPGDETPEGPQEAPVGNPALGETYTWDDGLSVTVSEPEPFNPSDYAETEATAHVAFTVTLVNGTDGNVDPAMFFTTLQSANVEAEQVFDSEQLGMAPSTTLLPGREVVFRIGYGVADPADLVLEVTPTFEHDAALFVTGD